MLSQSHIWGLLQSLDFSEGTGTTLNDKSGNNNHATVVGGTWTTDRFGRANRAILLDGVDDYIDLGLANYQGDVTVIASVYPIGITDLDAFITKSYNGTAYLPNLRCVFRTATMNAINFYSGGSVSVGATGVTWNVNKWNMLGYSFRNGVGGSQLANGLQTTTQNANVNTAFATGYKFLLGDTEEATARFPNLVVDRIFLFNRAMSGHELSKISNRLKIGDLDK